MTYIQVTKEAKALQRKHQKGFQVVIFRNEDGTYSANSLKVVSK